MSKYKLLESLLAFYPKPRETDPVAAMAGMDPEHAARELVEMLADHEPYGPLVELCRGQGWRITGRDDYDRSTGGRAFLREASINPYYTDNSREWKDEALSGTTKEGKESGIKNAAIPGGSSSGAYCNDPEARAMKTNERLTGGDHDI